MLKLSKKQKTKWFATYETELKKREDYSHRVCWDFATFMMLTGNDPVEVARDYGLSNWVIDSADGES
jgi:hypothetical protein